MLIVNLNLKIFDVCLNQRRRQIQIHMILSNRHTTVTELCLESKVGV